MPFQTICRARFYHVDRAGIAFFSRAYEYAHGCFEDLLDAAFGSFDDAFKTMGVIMPLVHSEASYSRPIKQGENLCLTATLDKMSMRSVTFRYEITNEDGEPKATVRLKHAFVDPKKYVGTERPDAFVTGMERIGLWPDEGLSP